MTAPSLATPSPLVSLFHDPAGTAFADLTIESHRETWPIRQTISKLVAARRACRPHAASGPRPTDRFWLRISRCRQLPTSISSWLLHWS